MELQRLRNARGLKPSQLARSAGHHSVARLLSEVNIAGGSHSLTSAALGSSGAPGEQLPRRAARAALPARAAQVARAELGRLPAAAASGGGISQEALLAALTQRAKLLLSLRATALGHDSPQQDAGPENSEVEPPVRPCLHSISVAHGYDVPLNVLLSRNPTSLRPQSCCTLLAGSSTGRSGCRGGSSTTEQGLWQWLSRHFQHPAGSACLPGRHKQRSSN